MGIIEADLKIGVDPYGYILDIDDSRKFRFKFNYTCFEYRCLGNGQVFLYFLFIISSTVMQSVMIKSTTVIFIHTKTLSSPPRASLDILLRI